MTGAKTLGKIREFAATNPDNLAFWSPARSWTFGELDRASTQFAHRLRSIGTGPKDRLACLSKHTPETILLWLAAVKLGAVCMPVNWRLLPAEISAIVRDGQARFLFADAAFAEAVSRIDAPALGQIVATHEAFGSAPALNDFIADQPLTDLPVTASSTDTAIQLYSSGTTGLPKGVELSWEAIDTSVLVVADTLGFKGSEHLMFSALPAFHIAGVVTAMLTIARGGQLVSYPDFDPAAVVEALESHRITHTFFVPAMIQFLSQVPGVEKRDFSHLQCISYGASPISEKVLTRAMDIFGCGFAQVYGLTETSGAVTALMPDEHCPDSPDAWKLRSAGRAITGVELRIVGPGTDDVLPDEQVGEVQIRTVQNLSRYWQNEQATTEALIAADPAQTTAARWFRSGDAGYLKQGYLFLHDRIKDLIISGGENIYPAEVENILMQHPDVADGAIAGVPDEQWGEAVKAFIVPRPGASRDEQAILMFMRERLAHFKCPRSIDWVSEIPRNPSGKILKRVLREPYWQGTTRSI